MDYEHTFAIVDFGKSPTYDIILCNPFMRQSRMVHDWLFNYIYLQKEGAIIPFNLKGHSYQDGARTPVEDLKSATTISKISKPIWVGKSARLWICRASIDVRSMNNSEEDQVGKLGDIYIPKSFLKNKFKPLGWTDVLATLDVCVDEVTLTLFSDEEGYDIMPLQIIIIVNHEKQNQELITSRRGT